MSTMREKGLVLAITLVCFYVPQVACAVAPKEQGFTAVSGTDKAVFDVRKKNNTALAVVAGAGTLALFTIGLTATKKRARLV